MNYFFKYKIMSNMTDYDIVKILKNDVENKNFLNFRKNVKDSKIFEIIMKLYPGNELYDDYYLNLECLENNIAFGEDSTNDCNDLIEIVEKLLLLDITP